MRRLFLFALLAACAPQADNNSPDIIMSRASDHQVRTCSSGAQVFQDPVTKRYTYYKEGGLFFDAGALYGVLPLGLTPQKFCAEGIAK